MCIYILILYVTENVNYSQLPDVKTSQVFLLLKTVTILYVEPFPLCSQSEVIGRQSLKLLPDT